MKETLRRAMRHVGRFGDAGTRRVSALVRGVLERARSVTRRGRDGTGDSGASHDYRSLSPAARARLEAHAGRVVTGSFTNAAGTRPYRLYVSGSALRHRSGPPLLVMLHGCKQDPHDFAAGTCMDEHAEAGGWLVLYPGQSESANRANCWNWFQRGDQLRDAGEPSLIADLTRDVIERYGVDRRRVYVAGLSAGGTMAATMAGTYPDLYAACGVHSGLPHGAAQDALSALHAMRHGTATAALGTLHTAFGRMLQARVDGAAALAPSPVAEDAAAVIASAARVVPTIVFHGDRDDTVHPCNAAHVIAQAHARGEGRIEAEFGTAAPEGGGTEHRSYTRTLHRDGDGRIVSEQWLVHGSGHAWSGGSAAGSYTDPLGPDASAEMLRFFEEHPHPQPALPQ